MPPKRAEPDPGLPVGFGAPSGLSPDGGRPVDGLRLAKGGWLAIRAPCKGRRPAAGGCHPYHSRSLVRKRAMDWLCSWQTRLSVTPSTAAISLRFMSCS